jgi:hypothetical protein
MGSANEVTIAAGYHNTIDEADEEKEENEVA